MLRELRHLRQTGNNLVKSLAFAPDGKSLAVSCGNGQLVVWDVETGRLGLDLKAPTYDDLAAVGRERERLARVSDDRRFVAMNAIHELRQRGLNFSRTSGETRFDGARRLREIPRTQTVT